MGESHGYCAELKKILLRLEDFKLVVILESGKLSYFADTATDAPEEKLALSAVRFPTKVNVHVPEFLV